MSQSIITRSTPLLRQRFARAGFQQASESRSLVATNTKRAYATEKPAEERPEFKAQLWESTSERVKREREEQARFAARRNLGGGGTGLAFTTALLMASGFCYWLGGMKAVPISTASTVPLEVAVRPSHDTSQKNLQAAWTDLKNIVGSDNITTEAAELDAHSGSSWSSYAILPADRPFAIVRPLTTEHVSSIMKVCHARRIPVTPYSGGTSLEGHFASTRGGICIDFSRMDGLLALHKSDLDVVVQPAMGWETLNETLAEEGLFFPPDPGPGAMIGGMVGTGCSGTNAYRYGTMKDWVLSLTVVLADGTIIKTRQRPRKSSAGYDLTRTFIGSEGTLGLVTEATLKVIPLPQNTRVAVSSFASVRAAADCVFRVVGAGVPIAAIEILDDVQMRCINDSHTVSKTWPEAPTLFFKFTGTTAGVKESIAQTQKLAKAAGSKTFDFARDENEAKELWQARKEALWSVMAKKREEGDRVWTTDVAVPISRLPDIIDETKADIAKSGLLGAIVGHVGDGNFHAILLYNEREREVCDGLVHRMVKRAIEMEGTATGEHGVGMVKRDYLEHELGKDAVDAMRMLKKAFDPLCLLNCDKIVRSQAPGKGEVAAW